ncbi:MAG: amidohydrolase family protein [Chitinophagaceae bacterium]|nr:amidohydrolase family protein [Oligoflexus sp.]
MPIYDTHAHVFPTVRERLADQLPSKLIQTFDEWAGKNTVPPGFSVLKSHWIKWLETLEQKGKSIDIETVAGFQARFSPQMFSVLEGLISAVLGPAQALQGTIPNLLLSMEKYGIDKTLVIATHNQCSNEWLLDNVEDRPELLAVTTLPDLPPSSNVESYAHELEHLIERGSKGFKIHTNFDNLPGDHPAYRAYFEVAKAHSKFVILHTGHFHVPQYRNSNAPSLLEFEGYFQEYPEVKVCLAHMNRDRPEDAWTYMKRYEQIYADTSWQTSANIRQAYSAVGLDRILFGSDWPLLHKELQGDALEVLRQALEENQVEKICGKNAEVFLGI